MELLHTITRDCLYGKGLAEGGKEGRKRFYAQAILERREEVKNEMIIRLYHQPLSSAFIISLYHQTTTGPECGVEETAGYASVTVVYVEAIAKEL